MPTMGTRVFESARARYLEQLDSAFPAGVRIAVGGTSLGQALPLDMVAIAGRGLPVTETEVRARQFALLLGGPGTGKSVFTAKIAFMLAEMALEADMELHFPINRATADIIKRYMPALCAASDSVLRMRAEILSERLIKRYPDLL